MFEDDFSFKFPELDLNFKDIDVTVTDKSTIDKINEYLDNDIKEYDNLIRKLLDFEKKLDFIHFK